MAARCTRIWWVRPVSSRTRRARARRAARATSKCVTASRASRVSQRHAASARAGRGRSAPRSVRCRARSARHERQVRALHARSRTSCRQPLVRLREFAPRRAARTCRDRAGARSPAGRGRRPRACPRVQSDERAACVARSRVHHEPRGLVHDEHVLVLVRNRHLGARVSTQHTLGLRGELDCLSAVEPMALRPRHAVDQRARCDRALRSCARPERLCKKLVEARTRRRRGDVHRAATSSVRRGGRGARSVTTSATSRIATPITMKLSARLKTGPPVDVDEVRHVPETDAIEEIRKAATDQRARTRPGSTGWRAAERAKNTSIQTIARRGHHRDNRRRPGEQAKSDAGVLDVVNRERPQNMHGIVDRNRRGDHLLRHLVGGGRGSRYECRSRPTGAASAPQRPLRDRDRCRARPSTNRREYRSRSSRDSLKRLPLRWSSMQRRAHGIAASRTGADRLLRTPRRCRRSPPRSSGARRRSRSSVCCAPSSRP